MAQRSGPGACIEEKALFGAQKRGRELIEGQIWRTACRQKRTPDLVPLTARGQGVLSSPLEKIVGSLSFLSDC
ncbi:MAG: hypothetical protein C0613_02915 [Desulfobulbaceae bacterium]|nr:MAG: hypothetical protein C0613_02915 [Desulfobulbaceae bacterium]